MWMMIVKKLIKPLFKHIKKLVFSVYAVYLLPVVLLILAYIIFGRQNFSLKFIILFCVVLALWLSALVNLIGKKQSIPEEVNELAKKFKKEFNVAKSKIYTAFYEVPFYIIVGEPGAGKTTMIKSSNFSPLGTIDEKREDEKKGVGGTRGCDWFIRKEIVFLDTAGLMSEDKELWEAFLNKVRSVRPLYPINGVLVVVPIDQLCHKKEKELQAGPSIPDMPDGGTQEGQFTIVPEFQYNIFGKKLEAGEESDIKNHIREKSEGIKERLQELQDILNFQLPVYIMLSKCDLLAGFRDFSHVLTEVEKDKIVGFVDFQDYDKIVEQLRQWQIKKTAENANYLKKSWLYLENLSALKDRLQPYHEAFSEFFGAPEPGKLNYHRGYFISSCKQHMVVGGGDSYKKSRTFFVKDFFSKKVLAEQGLGKPGEELTSRKQVITGRIKIATLASIVGVILWVIGYFLLNYSAIQNMEKKTSELKNKYSEAPKVSKDLHLFRNGLVRQLDTMFSDFKKTRTSSLLFVASWSNEALEVQTKKAGADMMYRHLIIPTLKQCLQDLGQGKDYLAPKEADNESLKGFVEYTNRLATVYGKYKNARKNLEGFEDIYKWVDERELGKEFKNVREACLTDEYKEILEKELAVLDRVEEQEIKNKLEPFLQKKFADLCNSQASFLASTELLDFYLRFSKIHRVLLETGETAEFEDFDQLIQTYGDWKKFSEINSFVLEKNKYRKAHKQLCNRDIENNLKILEALKDNPFVQYKDLKDEYRITQKETAHKFEKVLNGERAKGAKEDEYEKLLDEDRKLFLDDDNVHEDEYHISALLLWLKGKSKQLDILIDIKKELDIDEWKKRDLDKVISILKSDIEKPRNVDDEDDSETVIPYEYVLDLMWRDTINDALKRVLEYVYREYLEKLRKHNRKILDLSDPKLLKYRKEDYLKRVDKAIAKACKHLKVFEELQEKVEVYEQWQESIDRLKTSNEIGTETLKAFLESEQFLNIISIRESRIKAKSLSSEELTNLLYAIPSLYDQIDNESDLSSWAVSMLKKDLLERVRPAEQLVLNEWEQKCSKAFQARNWEDFHKSCQIGRGFYEIVLKERPNSETAQFFRGKYQDLVRALYDGVIGVFTLEMQQDNWGETTLAGFPINDNMESYLQWTQSQLGEYVKVFAEQNIPRDVLESRTNSRYYAVIKNVLEETKKQQRKAPNDFNRLYGTFNQLIIPWLNLKKDREIEKKLASLDMENIGADWAGKQVLVVYNEKYLPFLEIMEKMPKGSYDSYVTHVFVKWRSYLEKDMSGWNEQALTSLADILKSEYSKVSGKFPFDPKSGEELTPKESDNFFEVFSKIASDYKKFMEKKEEKDLDWKAFFRTYEKWQATLYGKQTKFELEQAQFQVKIKFPGNIPQGNVIESVYFANAKCYSLGRVTRDSYTWKWGDPVLMKIKFIGGATVSKWKKNKGKIIKNKRQILFEASLAKKNNSSNKRWELFRMLYQYRKEVRKGRVKLSFPYRVKFNGKLAKAKLELEFFITLEGQEGQFRLPWKNK